MRSGPVDRRDFLKWTGMAMLTAGTVGTTAGCGRTGEKADYTLRIGQTDVEVAPSKHITTTTYNGQFPGPLLRFTAGERTRVDVGAPSAMASRSG